MTYAHITAGAIDQIGQPPRLYNDGTRWWDLRSRDPELLASLGWLPVTTTPRPADTDTTTTDLGYAIVDGQPTQVWAPRPWTADELAAKQAATEHESARAAVRAIITDLRDEKARTQTVLDADNATIKANPQSYIKDVARAAKRIADAAIDLARFVKDN